jgi:serine/threonine protein kinase
MEQDTENNITISSKELFHSLCLDGWKESGNILGHGGQSEVLEVQHTSGVRGAFRYLKDKRPKSVQRFFREVTILNDPKFQHPNIIHILAHSDTVDTSWYISELGIKFSKYWNEQRNKYQNAPDSLLQSAIDIILQILNGLAPLHDAGVVHRDIKPDNLIIVYSDNHYRPVLIDFGIAYVDEEERLTSTNDAAGNARYSPDVMMNRMDNVPPWLDVFQISQLLIWMVHESPSKNWSRPLDWKYVNYHPNLSDNLALSMRAITSLCSNENTSPHDARELSTLINQLFTFPSENVQRQPINSEEIRIAISKGRATQAVKLADDERIISSSYMVANQVYLRLRHELENIFAELITAAVPVRKISDSSFDAFYAQLLNNSRENSAYLYELEFGEQEGNKFKFIVQCSVFTPSLQPYINGPVLPNSSNVFTFALVRNANLTRVTFPVKIKFLTIERAGNLVLRDAQMLGQEETNVDLIGQMVRLWLSDNDAWEIIQRDR